MDRASPATVEWILLGSVVWEFCPQYSFGFAGWGAGEGIVSKGQVILEDPPGLAS